MSDYICPHNCAYRTNTWHCGMEGGYESCQYIKYLEKLEKEKTNIKHYARKRTNADRIRAMSDEELAERISEQIDCEVCRSDYGGGERPCDNRCCLDFWLDWLREEAET